MRHFTTPNALGVLLSVLFFTPIHGYVPDTEAPAVDHPQVLKFNLRLASLGGESGIISSNSHSIGMSHVDAIPNKDGSNVKSDDWGMDQQRDESVVVVDSFYQVLDNSLSDSAIDSFSNADTKSKYPQVNFHDGLSHHRGLKHDGMYMVVESIENTSQEAAQNGPDTIFLEVGMDSKDTSDEMSLFGSSVQDIAGDEEDFTQDASNRSHESLGNPNIETQVAADPNLFTTSHKKTDSMLVHADNSDTRFHRRLASWTDCEFTGDCTGHKLGRYKCYLRDSCCDWEGDAAHTAVTINGGTFTGCDEQFKHCPFGCWAMYGYFNSVPEDRCGGLSFGDLKSTGCLGSSMTYSAKVNGLDKRWNSYQRRLGACKSLTGTDPVTRLTLAPYHCEYNSPWWWFGSYEVMGHFSFSHDISCSKEVKVQPPFIYNDYLQWISVFKDSDWPMYRCPTGTYIVSVTVRSEAVLDAISSFMCSGSTAIIDTTVGGTGGYATTVTSSSGFCGWEFGSGNYNSYLFWKSIAASQFKLIHCSNEVSGPFGYKTNNDIQSMQCPTGKKIVGLMAKSESYGYFVDTGLFPLCEAELVSMAEGSLANGGKGTPIKTLTSPNGKWRLDIDVWGEINVLGESYKHQLVPAQSVQGTWSLTPLGIAFHPTHGPAKTEYRSNMDPVRIRILDDRNVEVLDNTRIHLSSNTKISTLFKRMLVSNQSQYDFVENELLSSSSTHEQAHEYHRKLLRPREWVWSGVTILLNDVHILQRHWYGLGTVTETQSYFNQALFNYSPDVLFDFFAHHVHQIMYMGLWAQGSLSRRVYRDGRWLEYYLFEINENGVLYHFIIDRVTSLLVTAYPVGNGVIP